MKEFIKEVLKQQEFNIYAHADELIEEHIERCLSYFDRIYSEKDLEAVIARYLEEKGAAADTYNMLKWVCQMLRDTIISHDIGKITPEFQRIKMKNPLAPEYTLINEAARHSMLSAIIYMDYYLGEIQKSDFDFKERKFLKRIAKLNSYVISRHHGRLRSFRDFLDKIKGAYGETVIESMRQGKLKGCEGKNITKKDLGLKSEYDSLDYFYCRLVYSVLVACDYYATTENDSGLKTEDFGNIYFMDDLERDYESSNLQQAVRRFEKEYSSKERDFREEENINDLRSMIFLEAEKTYLNDPEENIYFLQGPTGSGKSNIAINLSIKMMKNRGKKLFYIYPFNTLVEQNRETMESMFSPDMYENIAVVNSLTPIKTGMEDDEDQTEYYEKALLDRQFLSYPIILSTHVSFLDLLFGAKRDSAFGFYQLSGAVVVLDEIQSYRNKMWGEFMIMLQRCAKLLDMQIIIMSATLPDLTFLSDMKDGVSYLLKDSKRYFKSPVFRNRVRISTELLKIKPFSLDLLRDHIKDNYRGGKKVIVEFMYKRTADEFYKILLEDESINIPVFCITGDDSLFERGKILQPIKNDEIKECILVSTQVLEAGADIDMDVGYKNISKLDSEEQFLGRINRSCRKTGIAYFFKLDDAGKIYADDYRMDKRLTIEDAQMERILVDKDFDRYYNEVLKIMKKFGLESTGSEGLEGFLYNELGILDFPAVAERLKLIEKDRLARNVFLCRHIDLENGQHLDGEKVWEEYKNLLRDNKMPFAEKKVKLSEVRVRMNHFIYQIRPKSNLYPSDHIGELMFYENGEEFFKNGRLDRKKLEEGDGLFIV